jgi:hypothetical protein
MYHSYSKDARRADDSYSDLSSLEPGIGVPLPFAKLREGNALVAQYDVYGPNTHTIALNIFDGRFTALYRDC